MKKISLFLFLGLALACSRMDVMLTLADRLFVSELDDYFDLTSEQSRHTRADFNKVLDQVRKELFHPVADRLEQLAQNVEAKTLTEKQISDDFDWTIDLFRKISLTFEKPTIDFLNSLSMEQISYFEEKSQDKLEDQLEKYETPKKVEKTDLKKFDRWISYTVEDLNSEQEQMLEDFVRTNPFPHNLRFMNQKKLTQMWIEKLRAKSDMKTFVSEWTREREKFDNKDYLDAKKIYHEKLKKFIFTLSQTFSDEQRKTFAKNLRSRAKDFRDHALK